MSRQRRKLTELPPLRKLFDYWIPETLTMMGALKFLQFLRLLGVKATTNGWRKVTSIFLRNESSKFILGAFRICPDQEAIMPPPDRLTAEKRLAARLAAYLRLTNSIRYWVEPGKLAYIRRRRKFCDLVLAQVDSSGMLTNLIPFFETPNPDMDSREGKLVQQTIKAICDIGNAVRYLPETSRAPEVIRLLKVWVREQSLLNYFGRRRRWWWGQRILHSTILFCDVLPETNSVAAAAKARTSLPDFRKFRNPGLGMMGAVARFTPDFREVDLFCQFNHVAVDGAPMQEFISKLKADWGAAGEICYPALPPGGISRPDIRYAGDGIFRAVFFMDLQALQETRKYLNEHCQEAMNGKATVAGLIMWAYSSHPDFASRKWLLPVDAGAKNGDRELGLLMIRPRHFARKRRNDPLADYCDFQKEMNRRMELARSGRGEVSEFLELCALMHPVFYHLARRIWPFALNEVLGTAGLTILRDAELFISPMTEFQSGGFIGIGNINVPTADGRTAAAISISGRRPQIASWLVAARNIQQLPMLIKKSEQ